MTDATTLPGYDYGASSVARSPVTLVELRELCELIRFGDEDARRLNAIGDVLEPRLMAFMEQLMQWTGPVALLSVTNDSGDIDQPYLEAAHARFAQGFLDTCRRSFDQAWLDYQHEIGLRHHRTKKNRTDSATAAAHIPFRWMVAFLEPTVETMRAFLKPWVPADDLDALVAAWRKAMLLEVVLYSRAYVPDDDW